MSLQSSVKHLVVGLLYFARNVLAKVFLLYNKTSLLVSQYSFLISSFLFIYTGRRAGLSHESTRPWSKGQHFDGCSERFQRRKCTGPAFTTDPKPSPLSSMCIIFNIQQYYLRTITDYLLLY